MTKVMVFGTFDLVHLGHLSLFEQAKKHGDELIVVVALDSTVLKTKGRKPFFDEQQRLKMIQALRIVDKAVLGNPEDFYKVINEEKPDVICLGYDQKFFVDKLQDKIKEFGLQTRIIRLKPFLSETYKSSKIRERLAMAERQ